MSLRTHRAMELLAVIAIVASACGTPTPSPRVSATPSATSPDGASADFRFAIDGEPTYFSPSSTDEATSWVNRLIYTGLYRVNNKGDVVPDLAIAMPSISPDGTTLTIKMRTDAKWHDGSPVTSADAAFTFDLAMSPKCSFNLTTCSTWHAHVGSVAAPSPDTLVITLKDKYAPIYIDGLTQAVVPKAATEASYAKFVAGSSAVDPAAVRALTAKISTAQGNPVCTGATPPDSCSASFFGVDMEVILTSAGVALPDKARFVGPDGTSDTTAYADALLAQLTDLNTTLQAATTDRLAAAYRLLDINLHPVGTGPFMFKEWVPTDHITIVKNPNYWNPANAAHLDQVTFKPIGDSTAKLQALQSGGVDAAETISPLDVKTAQGAGLTILDRGASCNQLNLDMNQSVNGKATIYANKSVRLAIAEAVNKQSYADAFYSGLGKVPTGYMPPAILGFKAETMPAYSVTQAKADLQTAGLTAAQMNVDLYYPSNVVRPYMPDPKGVATAIANDLTAVGFTVTLKTEDWHGGYVGDATNGKLPLYLFGWTCDWAGADDFLVAAWFGFQGGQPNAEFHWNNPQVNTLMTQAVQAPSDTAANALWGQVQDLVAQDMPMVPIVNSQPPGAIGPKVHGYVGSSNEIEFLNSVWLSQ